MSLIEEALRKQREETERTQTAAPTAPAPQTAMPQAPAPAVAPPPPLPPGGGAPAGEPPEKNRRTWRLLIGVGAFLLIALAAVLWVLVYGLTLFHKAPGAVQEPSVAAAVRHPTPGPATQTVQVLPPAAVTTAVAAVAAATIAPTDRLAATLTGTVAVAALAPTPAPTSMPVAAIAAVPAPRVNPMTTAVETLKLPVVWPRLTVSGLMGGGRGVRGTVIINGQMLSQGDMVDGAKILTIDKGGVTLKFSGETRTLAVGTSTE